MAQFRIPNRDQLLMLETVDLKSAAPVGSVVRTIDIIVDRLDLSAIEKEYDIEDSLGRPPFHPKTIIKVCLLALYNCRFSTRKMEEDTKYNLQYRYLTGCEVIDHTTIAKFLSKHRGAIIELFVQIVGICEERDLIDFEVLAVDTVKVKANASYKQSKNKDSLKKERARIKQRIAEIVDSADGDKELVREKGVLEKRLSQIAVASRVLKERLKRKCVDKNEEQRKVLVDGERVNITDPSVTIMSQANGERNPMYAITTATDTRKDVISHFEVRGEYNDQAVLMPVIEGSVKTTGMMHKYVPADAKFSGYDNYEKLAERGIDGYIPDIRKDVEDKGLAAKREYDRSKFKYDSERDEYRCPRGEILRRKYKMKGSDGRQKVVYGNREVCRECVMKERCTRSKEGGRKIIRDINEEIREAMRAKLDSKEGKEIYKQRAHTAEAPFGNVKHNLKFRHFMRRGVVKITMECALIFMLHNIIKLGSVLMT